MWLLNKCGRDLCWVLLFFLLKKKKALSFSCYTGIPYLLVGFLNALKVDFLGKPGWAQFSRSLTRAMITQMRQASLCAGLVFGLTWLVSHAQRPSFHLFIKHDICLDQETGGPIGTTRWLSRSLAHTFPSPATNCTQGKEWGRGTSTERAMLGEEHRHHVCHSWARKQCGKGKLYAVWPAWGGGALSLWGTLAGLLELGLRVSAPRLYPQRMESW